MILPLLTTTAVVLLPEQVVPSETTSHAPSKLPPQSPPLRREVDRRGSSASGLLRRALAAKASKASPIPYRINLDPRVSDIRIGRSN